MRPYKMKVDRVGFQRRDPSSKSDRGAKRFVTFTGFRPGGKSLNERVAVGARRYLSEPLRRIKKITPPPPAAPHTDTPYVFIGQRPGPREKNAILAG